MRTEAAGAELGGAGGSGGKPAGTVAIKLRFFLGGEGVNGDEGVAGDEGDSVGVAKGGVSTVGVVGEGGDSVMTISAWGGDASVAVAFNVSDP